ncbi:acetoacetate--CoA ligase [Aquabacter sp. CN5-332]|uniref:acetoacetate--CoA ligase n=1 Tax=Aquabacter sp. CN5-332 TaxID=3156608 RepID=UPI0032B4FED4
MSEAEHPLFQPSAARVASTHIAGLISQVNSLHGTNLSTYRDLHAWSIKDPGDFWSLVWDDCKVIGEKGSRQLIDADKMPGAKFFPDAKLNFAENLLRGRGDGEAMVFWGEDKAKARVTHDELRALVSRLQQALKAEGVGVGDRVAAMMPNMPQTVAIMLATASLGAIFSSCSPDFGERGVLDRFGQIEPKVFFCCDGYWYNGKRVAIADKLAQVAAGLPTPSKVVVVPYLGEAEVVAEKLSPRGVTLDAFIAPFVSAEVTFERVPFNQPLYICFSSGTTGVPKCIVHGVGGTLLQHMKEHRYQSDFNAGDRLFYFSTCGWMMWNWLVSGLAIGATLCLYDGSPFAPGPQVLFDYAQAERFTLFGTSAKYIDSLHKEGLRPRDTHDLSSVKLITSTGSPLAPEGFDYVYDAIKSDVPLASISGGTDIISCFVLGDPTSPVWKGEIQAAGLGMAVDVWSEDGKPVKEERGELVCTRPFPSMPVMFWNDPEGAKYHAAYFERFPNVWCHGDFALWTKHGGMVILGRSDATLNPQGVRIGTAEIYAQVEQIPDVLESVAIGQEWDNDVRVVLFVRLREGVKLDDALTAKIKTQIRTGASPRHVPAKVVQVGDIPRTRSGKITELAVREVVHGRPVKNTEALANPEALSEYKDLETLKS